MDDRPMPAHGAAQGTASGGTTAGSAAAESVRAVWHEHRRWVAAVLLAYKPAHAELDDLLQDVAVALVKNIADLRSQRNVRAWLRIVAMNAARAAARPGRNRPMLRLTDGDDRVGTGPVGDQLARDEEGRRLLTLTRELPPEYAEPLLLRAVHGLSAREVALILETTEVAVHNRVSRARRMLRERIERSSSPQSPACVATSPDRRGKATGDHETSGTALRLCEGGVA